MSNGFENYESDCDKVWVYRLVTSYHAIERQVRIATGKELELPVFDINPNIIHKWASWQAEGRRMVFSSKLLRNFEWSAVEHVMRHEVAHQIVSEMFGMDCVGVAHGEAWKRACKIVGIEPLRCESETFLSGYKGCESAPMVERVRKIIIHANDGAATEEEADLFMRKARELMLRHDIEMKDVMGTEKVWVTRPFGPLFKRWPAYMWKLGDLLKEHYQIKHIRTNGPYILDVGYTSRLELFGEPDKLDIAEYVGHALLNQAELLYEAHRLEVHEEKMNARLKGEFGYQRRLSKRAFINGLIEGYSLKLGRDKKAAMQRVGEEFAREEKGSAYVAGDCAMVPTYDVGLMEEMYGKNYPRLRTVTSPGSRGMGREAGQAAGEKLTLARGVAKGSNVGRLLTA